MKKRTKSGHVLNWNKSLPMKHKNVYRVNKLKKLILPSSVDLRANDSPIFDQGQEGSCTANASCGNADYLEIKKGLAASPWLNPQKYINGTFVPASRAFVYWVERALDGDPTQDQGSYLHTAAEVFTQKGACSEEDYPYGPQTLFGKPSSTLFGIAWHHRVSQALNIANGDLASMQATLAEGYPFILGFTVYESFEEIGSDGMMPMPSSFESVLGGHAVCAVGYNNANQTIICRNSWGTSWGDNGYFYMPYAFISDIDYASDFWTFR